MSLRRGGGFLAKVVLTIYVVSIALLPLSHHDVICHLKSPNHCTTCLTTLSGEATPHAASIGVWTMADAGRADVTERGSAQSAVLTAASGRAPPAIS
jgi:hypothetical protein